MFFRAFCLVAFLFALGSFYPVSSQNPIMSDDERKALFDKHKSDYDYMLGDWEFSGVRKRPTGGIQELRGYMSAARFPLGAEILSQDRLLNSDGSTYFTSSTLMAYNAGFDRWELTSTDDGGTGIGLQDHGTAGRDGADMKSEMHFGTLSGRPTIWRIRHTNIRSDGYTVIADRSVDGGKTWVSEYERLEVRRICPARTLAPLLPPNASTVTLK